MSNEKRLREALVAYMAAGVGNSTDHQKQADARRLAMESLREPPAQPAQGEAVGWYKVFSGETSLVHYRTFLPEDALSLGWQKVFLLAPPTPSVQPAQGEAVCPRCDGSGVDPEDESEEKSDWPCRACHTAPPAPAVSDDVAKDAARYRWLRDNPPCWMKHSGDIESGFAAELNRAIDAAMLAAAPEIKS